MCFYLQTKNRKMKIATEDILCLKQLNREGHYYNAIHYYIPYFTEYRKTPLELEVENFSRSSNQINKGLHTFCHTNARNYQEFNKYYRRYTFKAIIPKGTKFYYNSDKGEYVSLKIIVEPVPLNESEIKKLSRKAKLQQKRLFN